MSTQTDRTGLIFICYSRNDSMFVDQLDLDLRRSSLNTWVDRRKVWVGNWQKQTEDAIDACEVFLVILTPHILLSDEAENEWIFARSKGKIIIPLEVVSCEVPFALARLQRIDFIGNYDQGMKDLMETLISLGFKPTVQAVSPRVKSTGARSTAQESARSSFGGANVAVPQLQDNAVPASFLRGRRPVIALIRQDSYGAFLKRLYLGAESMAEEFGVDLTDFEAPAQKEDIPNAIRLAVESQVDALIIDHGSSEVLRPEVVTALNAGVRVVTFDLVLDLPEVPEIEQNDFLIGTMIAQQVVNDFGGQVKVIYANIDATAPENAGNYAPLEKRDRGWQAAKWRHKGLQEIERVGVATFSTATDNEPLIGEALDRHPDVQAVVAMWDEFGKAAIRALKQRRRAGEVAVYSVDIAHENIHLMREEGSPWRCAVATDSRGIGRLAVRCAVAQLGGETPPKVIQVSPSLITREFLLDRDVRNMDQLVQAIPTLGESAECWYRWMQFLLERNGYRPPLFLNW